MLCMQLSYDILLLILMGLLLVQAVLTLATIVQCASYKSKLRMGAPEWNTLQLPRHCQVSTKIYP